MRLDTCLLPYTRASLRFAKLSLVPPLSQIQELIPPAESPFVFLQMMQCGTWSPQTSGVCGFQNWDNVNQIRKHMPDSLI